jgi:hypothetical protein
MELTIKLTDEQVQRALIILGNAPYKEIADVIDTIRDQANEQIFANGEN